MEFFALGPFVNPVLKDHVLHRELSVTASQAAERVAPQFGHRIAIDSREGVFIVLRVDPDHGTVDVLRITGMRQIEAGIPVSSVRILSGQNSGDLLENADI